MPKDRIGLTLNGDVSLDLFAEAMRHFSELIDQLSCEIGQDAQIEWQVVELDTGSATAAVCGISPNFEMVERVVNAYETIGAALELKKTIPYSSSVVKAANSIANILDGKISSLEFFTPDSSSHITESTSVEGKIARSIVFGSISGLVETLSRRQTLRFILYDNLFDRAVKCFFEENQREMMRNVWDKKVNVTGMVLRDLGTGRPLEVRNIERVEIIPDTTHGSFKAARGVIPWKEGYELSDKIIRRVRDED
jgi:hypothetical protein